MILTGFKLSLPLSFAKGAWQTASEIYATRGLVGILGEPLVTARTHTEEKKASNVKVSTCQEHVLSNMMQ